MRLVNLLVDLADPRFAQDEVHHELEALDRRGVYPLREHRTPERVLGWIDGEFGGTWSSEAALGGIWIAMEAERPIGFAAYDARGLRAHWLHAWTGKSSVGIFGPIGVAAGERGRGIGRVLARAGLFRCASVAIAKRSFRRSGRRKYHFTNVWRARESSKRSMPSAKDGGGARPCSRRGRAAIFRRSSTRRRAASFRSKSPHS
ncbi:MAG: GNAT family N-acetyltransferase [Candidatus Eremiobacteraeota bacterium]|nr:GNAT family N-acetyltransferase [Candidatus Eremiobacteraeota bacterium]